MRVPAGRLKPSPYHQEQLEEPLTEVRWREWWDRVGEEGTGCRRAEQGGGLGLRRVWVWGFPYLEETSISAPFAGCHFSTAASVGGGRIDLAAS